MFHELPNNQTSASRCPPVLQDPWEMYHYCRTNPETEAEMGTRSPRMDTTETSRGALRRLAVIQTLSARWIISFWTKWIRGTRWTCSDDEDEIGHYPSRRCLETHGHYRSSGVLHVWRKTAVTFPPNCKLKWKFEYAIQSVTFDLDP